MTGPKDEYLRQTETVGGGWGGVGVIYPYWHRKRVKLFCVCVCVFCFDFCFVLFCLFFKSSQPRCWYLGDDRRRRRKN